MTLGEAHALFQLRIQEVGAERQSDFQTEEVDEYLGVVQLQMVRERLPLIEDPGVRGDLSSLLVAHPPLTPSVPRARRFTLTRPGTALAVLRVEVTLIRTAHPFLPKSTTVTCDRIRESDVQRYETTSLNDPWIPTPGMLEHAGKVEVFCDSDTVVSAIKLHTVTRPPTPRLAANPADNVGLSLHEGLHHELVERAVQTALGDLIPKAA
jgi:hypothetical protein